MKLNTLDLFGFKNIILLLTLLLIQINNTYSYSPSISRTKDIKTDFGIFSFIFNNSRKIKSIKNDYSNDNFYNLHNFSLGSSENEIHCGEIVLGTPIKRNQDGTILVDIGRSQPLIASKSSLYFMNEDEHHRLNSILTKKESEKQDSLKDIIYDTIHNAKKIPERKRQTYMIPKYKYPYDYFTMNKKKNEYIPYDIGVGSEIRPQDYSLPLEPKIPEYLKNKYKMEFLVTDISPYSKNIYGEFFSVNILEAKRRVYSKMLLDSLSNTSHFVPYEGIISELMGEVVKVQIVNGKYSDMYGLNAYAMSNPNDKIGNKIRVYLAGCDISLEQVYLFRTQISNPMLRKENVFHLMSSIVKYYAKTGKWYKAQVHDIETYNIMLRLFGDGNRKYFGFITKNNLPYDYPESLLNEAFLSSYNPNEYFKLRDSQISLGKYNYIYHYDNSLYVRPDLVAIKGYKYQIETVPKVEIHFMCINFTTKNWYKPSDVMIKNFIKILHQDESQLDIKMNLSYPCVLIGNEGGLLCFAINYKFKDNFTLDDDYYVGIMEVGNQSVQLPMGSIVHAKISKIRDLKISGSYAVEPAGKYLEFKRTPITEWISKLSDFDKIKYKLKNINKCSLLIMSPILTPSLDSPQFNEFLFEQPLFKEHDISYFINSDMLNDSLIAEEETEVKFGKKLDGRTELYRKLHPNLEKNIDKKRYVGDLIIDENDSICGSPIYYSNNQELREIYIKDTLDPSKYKQFLRNIRSSKESVQSLIREFFISSEGVIFWEFLESLRDPIKRRKITLKLALEFERSILKLLSVIHTFYLESIYETIPKELLMFYSVVPNSFNDTYFTLDELKEYYDIVRGDFVIEKKVSRSLINILNILTNPNYSLMALLRQRHRLMSNDVYFFYSKSLNYDSYRFISRPYVSRTDPKHDLEIPLQEELSSSIPMLPYRKIMADPKSFINELEVHGLTGVRKIYSTLLKLNTPFKSKYIKPCDVTESEEYMYLKPEDLDNPELNKDLDEQIDINEMALNTLDGSKESLKLLSKSWKRLNRFPENVTTQDIKEYIEDLKKVNRVHGIKLPIF